VKSFAGKRPIMTTYAKKILRWLPALAVMALIFYLSTLPSKGDLAAFLIFSPTTDNIVSSILHIGAFGFLALTIEFGFGKMTDKERLWALVWVILYGISDEFHQSFVPNRTTSLFDLLLDGLGGWLWLYRGNILRKKRTP
jgi:VanZ family protein